MFRRILQTFKYSIFPSKCLACGLFFHPNQDRPAGKTPFDRIVHDPIETIFYRVMTPFLCPSCAQEFSPVHSPFCTTCGRMFKSKSGADHQCGSCIQNKTLCHRIRAAGIYCGPLKSNIHALKYKNKVHLARPLGRLLFSSFMKYYDISTIDYILPVPLHISRLKKRGFNQAVMLINEWPVLINLSNVNRKINTDRFMHIDCKNLVRKRKTLSQTGLGKEKRKENVKGAFAVTDKSKISGKQVLLIDDVHTTGSTCDECADTLIASGAKTVSVLTLARAD
ncbi:MAG: ComF family protein [Desulfobacteraceae bacterium]|nr:ComF family protein [Desulfobacteraceae bacterium]MBC2754560.1 ComF family protein [Desulfobacteraceae bacterium]MBC2763775.1 ComF family protein [ANME-2 cluster archaeon]